MAKKKLESANVEFNMTPMIDVTFQLIIFFIITGQIISHDLAELKPPRPDDSVASVSLTQGVNLIVNIRARASEDPNISPEMGSQAFEWFVGGETLKPEEDLGKLTEIFENELAIREGEAKKEFTVELRSDFRVRFADVETVLIAASEAGIPNMNITAIALEDDS